MSRLAPIITATVNGKIILAECPICHDPIPLGKDIGSVEEQQRKLEVAFQWHMENHHPKAA